MKRSYFFLSALAIFCSLFNTALAQYPGMQKVYTDMAMRDLQRSQNNFMNFMTMRNANNLPNHKLEYVAVMKDSSKIQVFSKMYIDPGVKKAYLLLVDKSYPKKDPRHERKIYADQTTEILYRTYFNSEPKYATVSATATDSCWLFKTFSGAINGYSYLSDEDLPAAITAIQNGNGPIVKIEEATLTSMVGNNENALALIRKKRYYQAIKRYNKDVEKANKN